MAGCAPLHVGVVEDDVVLRERVLLPRLDDHGFHVQGFACADELRDAPTLGRLDLMVLDIGLPGEDGFALTHWLRRQHPALGIVILSARDSCVDRVRGLGDGADAYLVKPVDVAVLAATLHSVARRVCGSPPVPAQPAVWRVDEGGWRLLAPDAADVGLTRGERALVRRLLQTPGALVTRDALIAVLTDNAWDFDTHRLDSMIHRLRRKVLRVMGRPLPLMAVHGQGYVFQDASAHARYMTRSLPSCRLDAGHSGEIQVRNGEQACVTHPLVLNTIRTNGGPRDVNQVGDHRGVGGAPSDA